MSAKLSPTATSCNDGCDTVGLMASVKLPSGNDQHDNLRLLDKQPQNVNVHQREIMHTALSTTHPEPMEDPQMKATERTLPPYPSLKDEMTLKSRGPILVYIL